MKLRSLEARDERHCHARVLENLTRLRLGNLAVRLDAVLAEAARRAPTYLDFLDAVVRKEVESKQLKCTAMGPEHCPLSLSKDTR
jgi:hypothetical protein